MRRPQYQGALSAIWIGLLAGLVLASTGCATRKSAGRPIFYPPSPSKPRVQYLTSLSASTDLRKPSRLLTFLIGTLPAETIGKPYGLCLHDQKLYVADTLMNAIRISDFRTRRMSLFRPGGAATLRKPINITADVDGTLYLTDTLVGQTLVYDPSGKCLALIGKKDETKPIDVAVGPDRFFVSDLQSRQVRAYSKKDQRLLLTIPQEGSKPDESLFQPCNLALDTDGNIYVSDMGAFRIQKYNAKGEFVRSFGSHGDMPGQFARPKGIAVDREKRLYAVDAAAQVVQIFDEQGRLLMFFGKPSGSPIGLNLPAQIIIDYDHVDLFQKYVADSFSVEHIIMVSNQYGPRKICVYGFGHEK